VKIYEYIVKIKDEFSKGYRDFIALGGSANSVVDGTKTKLQSAANASSGLESTFKSLGRTIATVFAIGTISTFVAEARDASIKFDSYKKAFSVTTGDGGGTFEFVRKESDRLGLSLLSASEGYKTLSGATMGTNLAGAETQRIFTAVAQAGSKLKISNEDQKGVFLALGQMLSKGKVSAEELRGQLGERMPGAFRLFADSLGVTTMQLDKMLQKGEVISADALPKFATMLEKTFGNAGGRVESMAANMQRATDKGLLLKEMIGNGLEPIMNKFYITLAKVYDWSMANTETLKTLGIVVGYGVAVWASYTAGVWLSTAATTAWGLATSAARFATLLFTGQMTALNIVMYLNPVGLIVAGIVALAAAFILAYNKVEWFRGGIWGLWEASKTVFSNIGDFFKKTFDPIFEAIEAFKEGRYLDAGKAIGKLAINLTPVGVAYNAYNTLGKGVGDSFNKGYASGVKKEGISLPGLGGASAMPAMAGADGGMGGGSSASSSTSTSDGISAEAGGKGKGVNVITHLGGIKIEINVAKLDEGLDQVEDKIREVIARIVNGGLYTATQ
jgi:tape measure domain-containing protein